MSNSLTLIQNQLSNESFENNFLSVIGGKNRKKLIKETGFAMQSVRGNEYLQKCTPESIAKAVMNVALTGLSLNPVLNQAYLVPRKTNGTWQAHLDPGYQGLISKAYELKVAKEMDAYVVYEGDDFEYDFARNIVVKYTPYHVSNKNRGKAKYVVAYAKDFDGDYKYVYLTIERVNEIQSRVKNQYIWNNNTEEMQKKTGIKALWKKMPKVTNEALEFAEIVQASNEAEFDYNDKTTTKPKRTGIFDQMRNQQVQKPEQSKTETVEAEIIEEEPNQEEIVLEPEDYLKTNPEIWYDMKPEEREQINFGVKRKVVVDLIVRLDPKAGPEIMKKYNIKGANELKKGHIEDLTILLDRMKESGNSFEEVVNG